MEEKIKRLFKDREKLEIWFNDVLEKDKQKQKKPIKNGAKKCTINMIAKKKEE